MSHRDERIERMLRSYRAPDEDSAAERGLQLVRAAFEAGIASAPRRRPVRVLIAAVAGVLVAGIVLTPAGAAVRDLIEDAITVEKVEHAPPRLPTGGSILTVNAEGAWIASEGGGRRFLGHYREATYSPRGLNVAVAAGRELSAVNQRGELRWHLSARGRVADPAWAPSALRIAYRAGSQLRLVEGDGAPDRRLARDVARVAPAWRPVPEGEPVRDVLAYAERSGVVRVRDVVESEPGLSLEVESSPQLLEWLDDGKLVVVGTRSIELFAADGTRLARIPQPPDATTTSVDAQPGAARVAVATTRFGPDGARSEIRLIRLDPDQTRDRQIFSVSGEIAGLAFAPDGRWLGFGWPGADSWLFLRPLEQAKLVRKTEAVPGVSAYFTDAGPGAPGFPRVLEWESLAGG